MREAAHRRIRMPRWRSRFAGRPDGLVGVGVATRPGDELDIDYDTSDYCNLNAA
jgi:hypothetical protein